MTPYAIARRVAIALARHPRTVLLAVILVSVAFASQLGRLQADPSPRALLASVDPAQERLEAEARATFGSSDNVAVIVVSSDDALSRAPLAYAHRMAQDMARMPRVDHVDALTEIPWLAEHVEEASLDDLEAEDTGEDDDEDLLGAAADLVAAAPDVFPLGMTSLSDRMEGRTFAPLVSSDEVSDEDVRRVHQAVSEAPQLTGRLVSRDRKSLAVVVSMDGELTKYDDIEAAVERIEGWLEEHAPPEGTSVALSGLPVVRTSLVHNIRADQRLLIPGTLIVSFVVLALSFRWIPAVVIPILSVAVSALWLLGGMAVFDQRLNVLTNMLPVLVMIIGLNEAVHIVGRYVEERVRRGDELRALDRTMRTMAVACLLTTLTSAAGFAALTVSQTQMLQSFGVIGAIGLLLAYAVTLLIVPAALAMCGPPKIRDEAQAKRGKLEYVLARANAAALRNPWTILSVSLLFTAGTAWASSKMVVDSALLDQFSPSDPVYEGARLLEREFEGVRPLEIVLTSPTPGRFYEPQVLEKLHDVAEWASARSEVLGVMEPAEPLAGGWSALTGRPLDARDALRTHDEVRALATLLRERQPRMIDSVLSSDGSRALVRVSLADVGSRATSAFVVELRRELESALRGTDVSVSFAGDAYMASRGLEAVVRDLSGSVLAAALVIFALLTVVLRDVRLAALAIPANLLPQVWTMAWMVARGIPLNASTAIIFSLSIGLAVDGSIHVVSRFKEERSRGLTITGSIIRSVSGTGRNILVSSFALVLGFSVMLLSNFVPVQRFAELIAVGMAGSLVATLVIQPVILSLWAPRSRLLRRYHAPGTPEARPRFRGRRWTERSSDGRTGAGGTR